MLVITVGNVYAIMDFMIEVGNVRNVIIHVVNVMGLMLINAQPAVMLVLH